MKKNAFTLIELIAVVVVLAILLAISIPSVTNLINESYKEVCVLNTKALEDAARDYVTQHGNDFLNVENKIVSINSLISENLTNPIFNPKTKEECGAYAIVNNDGKRYTYQGYINCGTVCVSEGYADADVTSPIITITGDNPVNINLGSTYVDEGATAYDNVDEDITAKIVVTGTVNTNIVGSYTITYSVTDTLGNEASAQRIVNVIDTVDPSITFGTNGNTSWAKVRSTSVTVSDAGGVDSSSLKYQWTTSTVEPNELSFNFTFINGESIITPAGVTGGYYLWVLAKDNSGNTTILRTNIFNLDNTAPVITMNGSSPVNINMGEVYSDAGATASDTHSGAGGVVSTGSVNTNVPGTYTISYDAIDNAGNAAVTVTRAVVVVDASAPTVTFATNGNTAWAKTRSTSVTVTDSSGVNASSLKYQWTTSTTAPSEASFSTTFTSGATINSPAGVTGGYYLWIIAKDTSNNTIITRSNVFNLDNSSPTAPVITGGSTSYALSRTITTSTISTDSGSGVSYYEYYLTSSSTLPTLGTTATANVTTTSTSQLFAGDYVGYYVYFRAIDNVGNVGGWSNSQRLYLTSYSWSKYSIATCVGAPYHEDDFINTGSTGGASSFGTNLNLCTMFSFNKDTGMFTCAGIKSVGTATMQAYHWPDSSYSSSEIRILTNDIETYNERIYRAIGTNYNCQGSTSYGTVYAPSGTYPDDGEDGGYWYVLNWTGPTWKKYNVKTCYQATFSSTSSYLAQGNSGMAGAWWYKQVYRCSSYSFSSATGLYTCNGTQSTGYPTEATYVFPDSTYTATTIWRPYCPFSCYKLDYHWDATATNCKGPVYYGRVFGNEGAYPNDGQNGSYWYVRQ